VTLIVSVLLLIVVIGGVAYMYRAGARGPADAPKPLGAAPGDARAPPPAQTPSTDGSAGLTISKDEANAPPSSAQTLAPPPEPPLEPAPAQAPTAAPAPPPPGAGTPSRPPQTRPAVAAADTSDAIDRLIARSEAVRPGAGTVESARANPRSETENGDRAVVVQIGAFSSESLADAEWNKAAAVAPGAMAGKGKRVVPVTRDGDTLYRTSITGFASRDQALALCARLKAAGGVCFVH
jgi:hypothetical protein